MATTVISNHLVFPSLIDINGGAASAGQMPEEATLASLFHGACGVNCVISGFSPVPTGAGLSKSIPAGVAVIDGYVIKGTSSTSFTFEDSSTLSLYLQLTFSGGTVNGVQLVSQTSSTAAPANSVQLALVVTAGGAVSSQTDRRPQNRRIFGKVATGGTISDSGSGNWSVSKTGAAEYTIVVSTGFFHRAPIMNVTTGGATILATSAIASSATSLLAYVGAAGGDFFFEAFL